MGQLKLYSTLPHLPFLGLGVEKVSGKGEAELKISKDLTIFLK